MRGLTFSLTAIIFSGAASSSWLQLNNPGGLGLGASDRRPVVCRRGEAVVCLPVFYVYFIGYCKFGFLDPERVVNSC